MSIVNAIAPADRSMWWHTHRQSRWGLGGQAMKGDNKIHVAHLLAQNYFVALSKRHNCTQSIFIWRNRIVAIATTYGLTSSKPGTNFSAIEYLVLCFFDAGQAKNHWEGDCHHANDLHRQRNHERVANALAVDHKAHSTAAI